MLKSILSSPAAILFLLLVLTSSKCETINAQDKTTGEPHRPGYHFTPPAKWMNDPNGMVYFKGEYHLFYQYYPDSTVWGPMHWGHAVSSDLVHWQHLPVALYPDSLGYIFSGSAVIDEKNTSGFGTASEPAMVAMYTYHNIVAERAGKAETQSQGIAYSTDRGRTWKKYAGNPAIPNPGGQRDFRDPKVFWHKESRKWIVMLATGDHISIYSSPNLKQWTYESEFGKDMGAHGGVWECPDLIRMSAGKEKKEKWVAIVNINPGGPNGGSAGQYFTGNFDGHQFTPDSKESDWLDYGKDNYASVTWSNVPEKDGRTLALGWMSNWQYAEKVPTAKWRSAMTFPRELKLEQKGARFELQSLPVSEIQLLREKKVVQSNIQINGTSEISHSIGFSMVQSELELKFAPVKDANIESLGLELYNEKNEKIIVGYEFKTKRFFIDRRLCGENLFSKDFNGIHYSKEYAIEGEISLHLLIDKASIELFAQNGSVCMTDIYFPSTPLSQARIVSKNGKITCSSMTVYKIASMVDNVKK